MFLSKNLKFLREQNGKLSQQKLGELIGSTRSAISSYEDGRAEPKLEVLNKIAQKFNITVDQLINIDLVKMDEAQIEHQKSVDKYVSAQNLRILTITVDDNDNEEIVLVPGKASAGYTAGYADETYLRDLPKYQLPFLARNKTFRAFEISGDSMLPLKPQSIVIGEYISDFNEVKDGQICIIVSRDDGVVLKKIYNRISDRNTLLLKSSNLAYPPYEIPAEEVIEIWKFSAYISKEFPEDVSNNSVQDLKEAFWRLEEDIREIKMGSNRSN